MVLEHRTIHTAKGLALVTEFGELVLDFKNDKINYLRPLRLGKNELIAKAVGISKGYTEILDVTAGLAQDAIVLARLGCNVTAIERSEIIYKLLEDAKNRAKGIEWVHRMKFVHGNSIELISNYKPQVIYMDPMFPENKKSALPRKEMQIFREIIGEDSDSVDLLKKCLLVATERVVVKRPLHAPDLLPGVVHRFKGKSVRYDLYRVLR